MNKLNLSIVILMVCFSVSCKKSSSISGNAALNVVHAAVGVNTIVVNFSDTPIPFYQNQTFVGFGSSMEFGLPSGSNPMLIVSSDDTTNAIFSTTFSLNPGGIYSFYLTGQASHIDTLFQQDVIPVYYDSSSGVRFINLSPDSKPFSISLQGNSGSQSEFENLGYKQISAFKTYSASSSVGGSYNFEVHDQASDSLLTTFSWNYSLQKNNTLVICGLESSGVSVFQVNNY